MLGRRFITFITAAFLLASCSDRRPEIAKAKADFSRLYPTADVVSVRVSEDEVIARSFAFTYRHPGQSQTKTLDIQYVKNDHGTYEILPAPPSELP